MHILHGPDYGHELAQLSAGSSVVVRAASVHDQQVIEAQFPDLKFYPSAKERLTIDAFNAGVTYPDATAASTIYRFFLLGQAYFAAVPTTPYTEPAMGPDGKYLDGAGVYGVCAQELNRFVIERHNFRFSFWAVDVALFEAGPVVVAVHDGASATLPDLLGEDVFYSILESKLNGTCCR